METDLSNIQDRLGVWLYLIQLMLLLLLNQTNTGEQNILMYGIINIKTEEFEAGSCCVALNK